MGCAGLRLTPTFEGLETPSRLVPGAMGIFGDGGIYMQHTLLVADTRQIQRGGSGGAASRHPPLLPKKTLVIIDLKKWKNGKMENCHNHALFPRGW
jgi:hypothetical protein